MNVLVGLDIISLISMIIVDIISTFAYTKRKDMLKWLPSFYSYTIGASFSSLALILSIDDLKFIGTLFYGVTVFLLFFGTIFEQARISGKSLLKKRNIGKSTGPLVLFAVDFTIVSIEIMVVIILLISILVLIKTYLQSKSIMHLFLLLALIGSFMTTIFTVISEFDIEITSILSKGFSIFFTTSLLFTSIISIVEIELDASKEKAKRSTNALRNSFNVALEASTNTIDTVDELLILVNDINVSVEWISSTTREVTLRAQQQAQSLENINIMAEDVKSISKVITNISRQTNLLALNASIEAGRAGEYGLGFAVVAEKVQHLAEESGKSVEKTSEIIESITNKIDNSTHDSAEISRAMEEISSAAVVQTGSMEMILETIKSLKNEAKELKESFSITKK